MCITMEQELMMLGSDNPCTVVVTTAADVIIS